METVGIYLKKEREANKISLRDVAQITKITGIYLEYIEKNEFHKIPQGPYIKGYLSSYSRAIGCDVDHTIRLYESANRQRPEGEAALSAIESVDAGQVSAQPLKASRQAQASHPRRGKLGSWLDKLFSIVFVIAGPTKKAKKTIETSDRSLPIVRRPFRRLNGRVKQSDSSKIINRSWTKRRRWMYAPMAIFGAFILFLAAAGFYHLFLLDPGSAIVAEAETSAANNKKPRPSDAGSRSSTVTSALTDTFKDAESRQDHVTNQPLSVPSASVPNLSGTKPELDTGSATSEPATQVVSASSAGSAATRHVDLLQHSGDASDAGSSDTKPAQTDSSPKRTITEASQRVLKATICRSIENRMPAGADQSFSPSDGQIYVWSMIESSQGPSTIHHVYYFGGKKISDVSLDVRSNRWRTWSSKRIDNNRYRGEWRVDITTSDGEVLKRLFFAVK